MHVLARLLATGAVALIVSAAPAALAQVEGCVADPASCVLSVPDPDPCVQDPAGCLPAAPDPDPCLQDPQSCLPLPALGLENGTQDQLQPATAPPGPPRDPRDEDVPGAPVVGGVRDERPSDENRSGRSGPPAGSIEPAPAPAEDLVLIAPGPRPDAGGALGGTVGGLAQVVQDYVFPLLLIAGVSIFLGIQSRIDRKDPKFTLAPVDSRHDVVEFR